MRLPAATPTRAGALAFAQLTTLAGARSGRSPQHYQHHHAAAAAAAAAAATA
jgi:hypothetical protein